MTYGLGRGLEYYDMPVVRGIVHDAAKNDYKFTSLITGIVRSTPFQMRKSQASSRMSSADTLRNVEIEDMIMFISKTHLSRRTFLQGAGATLALPFLDSMIPRNDGASGDKLRHTPWIRLRAARRDHGQVDADHRRRRLRIFADPETARAVPRPPEHRQRPGTPRGRFHRCPFAEPDHMAQRRSPQTHAGHRRFRGRDGRSDRRAGHRPGHDSAVDGTGDRRPLRPDRRLRSRLRLHLHEHALLADANHAAAHGDQPAKSFRADVRTGRQRRGPRSRASQRTAASWTASRRKRRACKRNWARRIGPMSASIWTTFAKSSGAFRRPASKWIRT